jgi:hypothetical protein
MKKERKEGKKKRNRKENRRECGIMEGSKETEGNEREKVGKKERNKGLYRFK